NYAGAFGAVTLFGILPALMVWAGRYNKKFATQTFVPGGKIVLLGIILLSGWMMWLYT
ncbi:MAG: aromatic amino acid transport family protein, partial [Parachlamydiaceae bacterium]